jgi:hypothetical protein
MGETATINLTLTERLSAHLSRLGGVLAHPRATFERILDAREGSLLELVPWAVLVAITVAPVEAGRAFLMFRVSIAEGIVSLLGLIANRMAPALGLAIAMAAVLYVVELFRRAKDERYGFDRLLDACAFTLVPFLALASLGAILASFDLELWWMPHRRIGGDIGPRALRVAVAFGWSITLSGWIAYRVWRRRG